MIIPLRFRFIALISVIMIILMIVYMKRSSRQKTDYEKITSSIIFLGKQLGDLPVRDLGKYRYLKIENYHYPFEIFVGNESGDFKPKFEKIDSLAVGDIISVYAYETADTRRAGINRFVQFIEKDNEIFFERGNSSKILGIIVISLSVLIIISCYILMKMKKIEY